MPGRPLRELVDPGWADALDPIADRIAALGDFLRAELAAGRSYLPAGSNVLRAFTQPFEDVRVLIVGQDPYPTPGHAVGTAVAGKPGQHLPGVRRRSRLPRAEHRRPVAVGRTWCPSPQPGPDRYPPPAGCASRQGLGGGHRPGDPRLGRPWYSTGGDLVGAGCTKPPTPARRRALHRVGAPEPDVRAERLLRFPAVQSSESAVGRSGRGAGRLEAALSPTRSVLRGSSLEVTALHAELVAFDICHRHPA